MADEAKVPLYFIGTDYPPTQQLVYTVRGRVYQPKTDAEGKIIIGGAILVDPNDVKVLIDKSRYYRRNQGFYDVFTADASVAAAVRQKFLNDEPVAIPSRMTIEQAASLLTPKEVRASVVADLSVEELKAALAQREGTPASVEQSEPQETVVEEKPVERAALRSGKPKPGSKPVSVVDDMTK